MASFCTNVSRVRISLPDMGKRLTSLHIFGGVARAAIRKRSARWRIRVLVAEMKIDFSDFLLGALRFATSKSAARRGIGRA
jgi:hypothetical protein